MLIGGEWLSSSSGEEFEATSPSTGEVIATLPQGAREDALRAIDAACSSWRGWANRSAFDRAEVMERCAELVDERREDLARTLALDQGKPLIAEAFDEVDELKRYFTMAAADGQPGTETSDAVESVIEQLEQRGLVTYRAFADEYRIWSGTDFAEFSFKHLQST